MNRVVQSLVIFVWCKQFAAFCFTFLVDNMPDAKHLSVGKARAHYQANYFASAEREEERPVPRTGFRHPKHCCPSPRAGMNLLPALCVSCSFPAPLQQTRITFVAMYSDHTLFSPGYSLPPIAHSRDSSSRKSLLASAQTLPPISSLASSFPQPANPPKPYYRLSSSKTKHDWRDNKDYSFAASQPALSATPKHAGRTRQEFNYDEDDDDNPWVKGTVCVLLE